MCSVWQIVLTSNMLANASLGTCCPNGIFEDVRLPSTSEQRVGRKFSSHTYIGSCDAWELERSVEVPRTKRVKNGLSPLYVISTPNACSSFVWRYSHPDSCLPRIDGPKFCSVAYRRFLCHDMMQNRRQLSMIGC